MYVWNAYVDVMLQNVDDDDDELQYVHVLVLELQNDEIDDDD